MTLPTFLVIGAGRSGTTSLHHHLGQHPDVFVCREKSPNFFVSGEELPPWEQPVVRRMAERWVRERSEYEALFDAVVTETAIGEVSPVYLQATSAAAAIHDLCAEVRLVAILRNPVDRAYAHFLGRRRDGLDPRRDFRQVVAAERSQALPDRVAFGHYLGCGRYHHFLRPYFDLFPREQIRIYLFEDLEADPHALFADLFSFLGVDPSFSPDREARYGKTGEIASPVLRAAWTRSVRLRTSLRPYLPASARNAAGAVFMHRLTRQNLPADLRLELLDVFREDIEQLQLLIGRDLAHWLP